MSSDLFVTGTDTNVGKTLLSALLVAALGRKYWKPIQTGSCEGTDRETVIKLAEISSEQAYPESYIFDPPVSPHLAAREKAITIDLHRIRSGGYEYSRGQGQESSGIRDCGAVIARARGHHGADLLPTAARHERVDRAADLERSGRQFSFDFEVDVVAG